MERLAQEAYMVGTEWDQYDKVWEVDWQFGSLEAAFEEGGVLHGQKVWVFGATEPQLVDWQGKHRVIQIPAVVAVSGPACAPGNCTCGAVPLSRACSEHEVAGVDFPAFEHDTCDAY